MSIYNPDYRTAAQLTGVARGAADAVAAADPLSVFMPDNEQDTLDYELDADTLGLPAAAVFRAFDATAPYGGETSVGSRKGSLPAISEKRPLSELAQLRLRQAGNDAIGPKLEEKAMLDAQAIATRVILARGQAISTGKVTIAENKVALEVDFGRDPSLTVLAATPWSNPDADVIGDLLAYIAAYTALNGAPPAGTITSSRVRNYMSMNKTIIAMRYGQAVDSDRLPSRILPGEVEQVLQSLGLYENLVYDRTVNVGGVATRIIADDRFLLVPSRASSLSFVGDGPLGSTLWGVPTEATQPKYGISGSDQAGIFAANFYRADPEGMDVLASAIVIPVLRNRNGVLSADVL